MVCLLGGANLWSAAPVYAAQECSKQDRTKIARFDRKAKGYKQDYQKLKDDRDKVGSMGKALKYKREVTKIERFFQSPEYNAMVPIYDRCQVMMPSL
mgnify:CR=1 FL=1|tara:strand:+ start:2802 stop:3092 length:291 start_codon:yes stop_codon:yes gene_type:complete